MWPKEKLFMVSNFNFGHNVFKSCLLLLLSLKAIPSFSPMNWFFQRHFRVIFIKERIFKKRGEQISYYKTISDKLQKSKTKSYDMQNELMNTNKTKIADFQQQKSRNFDQAISKWFTVVYVRNSWHYALGFIMNVFINTHEPSNEKNSIFCLCVMYRPRSSCAVCADWSGQTHSVSGG